MSPAVPEEATLRSQALADREGWTLTIIDAGEFAMLLEGIDAPVIRRRKRYGRSAS